MNVSQHFNLLGLRVQDKVTGFSGVCTALSFDLYGCITVLINPGIKEDGKLGDQQWFDVSRMYIDSKPRRVMDPPDYTVEVAERIVAGYKGACDKPLPNKV